MIKVDELSLFDQQNELHRELNKINAYQLYIMLEQYPALRNSWDAFITDYKLCLSTIDKE